MPLVSVIIPCYNAEAFVGEAIESALAQTYSNTEVIVIDDGSTDGTLEVLRSFGERIRWESGPNRGACAARNRGLDLARGEVIQFLDADDLLFPDKINRMLLVSGSGKKEILFSDFRILDINSGNTSISPRPDGDSGSLRYMLAAERLSTSAPLYHSTALREVAGFDADLPCAQEYDLNLRLALNGWRFRRLPEVLYEVRSRSGSLSSNYARVLIQHESIFMKLLQQNPRVFISQQDLRYLLSWRFVRNARLLTNLGDTDGARLAVSRARQLGILSGINQAFSWKSRVLVYLVGPTAAELTIQRLVSLSRLVGRLGTGAHKGP